MRHCTENIREINRNLRFKGLKLAQHTRDRRPDAACTERSSVLPSKSSPMFRGRDMHEQYRSGV